MPEPRLGEPLPTPMPHLCMDLPPGSIYHSRSQRAHCVLKTCGGLCLLRLHLLHIIHFEYCTCNKYSHCTTWLCGVTSYVHFQHMHPTAQHGYAGRVLERQIIALKYSSTISLIMQRVRHMNHQLVQKFKVGNLRFYPFLR